MHCLYSTRHRFGQEFLVFLLPLLALAIIHEPKDFRRLSDRAIYRRFRRQALTVENIMVHSLDSNVSVLADGHVLVKSSASRIDILTTGRQLAIGLRANVSSLLMDGATAAGRVQSTAAHNFSIAAGGGAAMEMQVDDETLIWTSMANEISLNSTRQSLPFNFGGGDNDDPTAVPVTTLRGKFSGGVNTTLTLRDKVVNTIPLSVAVHDGVSLAYRVDIRDGDAATAVADKRSAPTLRIISAAATGQVQKTAERSLTIIAADANNCRRLRMGLMAGEMTMLYDSLIRVDVSSSFRTVVVRRGDLALELYAPTSAFQLSVDSDTARRIRIDCTDAKTSVILLADAVAGEDQLWTSIVVQQQLHLELNRHESEGSLRLWSSSEAGHPTSNVTQKFERIALGAKSARISLGSAFIDVSANHSAMGLFTNFTKAQFAARNQRIRVAGASNLRLQAGTLIISMRRLAGHLSDSPAAAREALELDGRRPFDETEMRQIGPNGYEPTVDHGDDEPLEGEKFSTIAEIPQSELPHSYLLSLNAELRNSAELNLNIAKVGPEKAVLSELTNGTNSQQNLSENDENTAESSADFAPTLNSTLSADRLSTEIQSRNDKSKMSISTERPSSENQLEDETLSSKEHKNIFSKEYSTMSPEIRHNIIDLMTADEIEDKKPIGEVNEKGELTEPANELQNGSDRIIAITLDPDSFQSITEAATKNFLETEKNENKSDVAISTQPTWIYDGFSAGPRSLWDQLFPDGDDAGDEMVAETTAAKFISVAAGIDLFTIGSLSVADKEVETTTTIRESNTVHGQRNENATITRPNTENYKKIPSETENTMPMINGNGIETTTIEQTIDFPMNTTQSLVDELTEINSTNAQSNVNGSKNDEEKNALDDAFVIAQFDKPDSALQKNCTTNAVGGVPGGEYFPISATISRIELLPPCENETQSNKPEIAIGFETTTMKIENEGRKTTQMTEKSDDFWSRLATVQFGKDYLSIVKKGDDYDNSTIKRDQPVGWFTAMPYNAQVRPNVQNERLSGELAMKVMNHSSDEAVNQVYDRMFRSRAETAKTKRASEENDNLSVSTAVPVQFRHVAVDKSRDDIEDGDGEEPYLEILLQEDDELDFDRAFPDFSRSKNRTKQLEDDLRSLVEQIISVDAVDLPPVAEIQDDDSLSVNKENTIEKITYGKLAQKSENSAPPTVDIALQELARIDDGSDAPANDSADFYRARFVVRDRGVDDGGTINETLTRAVAEKLNALGAHKFSNAVKFKVISPVRVRARRSATLDALATWLVVIPAGAAIIAVSGALAFCHIAVQTGSLPTMFGIGGRKVYDCSSMSKA